VVLDLATHGNRYIDNAAPWSSIKGDRSKAEADLAVGAHLVRCLAILASPFLPTTAERINRSVGVDESIIAWQYPEPSHVVVRQLEPLYKRIEEQEIVRQRSLLGRP